MKRVKILLVGWSLCLTGCLNQWQTETNASDQDEIRVAFYNVENLFDTADNPARQDDDFLPDGPKQWTSERYQEKLAKLAKVVTALNHPVLLGLAEVENEAVLRDLIGRSELAEAGYDLVHYDSPDARGIDVALLYRTAFFTPVSSQAIPVTFAEDNYRSRDLLLVSGTLGRDAKYNSLHVLVNHWPSRRGGVAKSEARRLAAATLARQAVDELLQTDATANVILMGDFNDEPTDRSITEGLRATGTVSGADPSQLFNTVTALDEAGRGTYQFRGNWNMLDQIILSAGLVEDERGVDDYHYLPKSAEVFMPDWLLQADSKYVGYPDRTYAGNKYLGGYSDHLPVYVELINEDR
jgi:predicted extracellular nuclease